MQQILDATETVIYPAGKIVFSKDEPGDSLYIVASGRVRVHDEDLVFRKASRGEVFGELAVLDNDVRSATITTEVETTLLRLERQTLYRLLEKNSRMVEPVIRSLCRQVRNTSQSWVTDFIHKAALERELEIGRQIQSSFLPEHLPEEPGWEIAGCFRPASQVAGDFYDAFRLPQKNSIALLLGDVSDKGVGAALFMTLFRTLIRASCMHAASLVSNPSHNLLQSSILFTNDYIALTHGKSSMFATLFFANLDPVSGRLQYINAGHEPVILFNQQKIKACLEASGPAVGLFPGAVFQTQETYLEPGDTLLAYTDGIVDAQAPDGRRFEPDRLMNFLQGAGHLSASDLLARLVGKLDDFMAGMKQFDDITLLTLKRTL